MRFFEQAFITILNMSITASYVAIAVILARMLLKKVPKVFSYALWGVVLFRLICPLSFSSSFSLLGLISPAQNGTNLAQYIPQDIGMMTTPAVDTGINSVNFAINAALPVANGIASVNPMQIWIALGALIWRIGVAVLLLYAVISYLRLKKQIGMAALVSDNIYEIDIIKSPFVCGLVRPKIYLPLSLTGQEREYILCHEQTHIKRFDYLVKPVAFLALALHWFNPLMLLCFFLMAKDMEMSCDERVIQRATGDAVTGYSGSLLALATHKKMPAPSPLAFGESNVKARIKNVLNYKKPAFWVVLVAVIACLAVAIACASNPKAEPVGADTKTAMKGLELYVWQNKELTGNEDIYYTLLEGTNRNKTEAEVYDISVATTDIEQINRMLASYKEVDIIVSHPIYFSKEEMNAIVDQIKIENGSVAVGLGWFENAAGSTIIGGADGPTSIFISPNESLPGG